MPARRSSFFPACIARASRQSEQPWTSWLADSPPCREIVSEMICTIGATAARTYLLGGSLRLPVVDVFVRASTTACRIAPFFTAVFFRPPERLVRAPSSSDGGSRPSSSISSSSLPSGSGWKSSLLPGPSEQGSTTSLSSPTIRKISASYAMARITYSDPAQLVLASSLGAAAAPSSLWWEGGCCRHGHLPRPHPPFHPQSSPPFESRSPSCRKASASSPRSLP